MTSKKIISQSHIAEGTITDVKRCWWLKINTKPVRASSEDGAVFPDVIHFTYSVKGVTYTGKKFIGINTRGIKKGDKISVCYDEIKPRKYTLSDNFFGREMY